MEEWTAEVFCKRRENIRVVNLASREASGSTSPHSGYTPTHTHSPVLNADNTVLGEVGVEASK